MAFSAAETVQIILGLVQVALAFLALKHQSEKKKPSEPGAGGGFTFWNCVEKFDIFAFVVSIGCLVLAATISLPTLLPWAERLARFTLLAMASAVFTLTVIRVQANKFSKQMIHSLKHVNVDGGEF